MGFHSELKRKQIQTTSKEDLSSWNRSDPDTHLSRVPSSWKEIRPREPGCGPERGW